MNILMRCRTYGRRRDELTERIRAREDAITRITAVYGRTDGGHGTGDFDKIADYLAAKAELEDMLQQIDDAYAVELSAAITMLDGLRIMDRIILHDFYIQGLPIHIIARDKGYSEGHVRRLKRHAESLLCDVDIKPLLPQWYFDDMDDAS